MKETRGNKQTRSGRPLPPGSLPGAADTGAPDRREEMPGSDDQPTPPGITRMPKSVGERPGASAPESAEPEAPAEENLADLDWMPQSGADRVARFLSDVAEIAPPIREREASSPGAPPAIVPSAPASPEEAERKKARAQPFWSEVLAAPMAHAAPAAASRSARRGRRKLRILWIVICVLILVVLAGVAALVVTHPGLLPGAWRP